MTSRIFQSVLAVEETVAVVRDGIPIQSADRQDPLDYARLAFLSKGTSRPEDDQSFGLIISKGIFLEPQYKYIAFLD